MTINITKTCLCNFDSLKLHFYIDKKGFAGVYIIFLISAIKQFVGIRENCLDDAVLTSTHNLCFRANITKTRLFKYMESFSSKKTKIFQIKNSDIFHISAQNIDCGYSLEPPLCLCRNKKNNVYPCKPQFYYIKVGFKGVKII